MLIEVNMVDECSGELVTYSLPPDACKVKGKSTDETVKQLRTIFAERNLDLAMMTGSVSDSSKYRGLLVGDCSVLCRNYPCLVCVRTLDCVRS
jgi:hypothetical protein